MKKLFLYLLISLISLSGKSQNGSLNQLINGILMNSSALKSQKNVLKMGEIKTEIQESLKNPVIGADLGISRIDPVAKANFNAMSLQFQPNMNYSTGFSANQVIYDWGKNALIIEKTRLENAMNQAQLEEQEAALAYQITQIYYQYQVLNQGLTVQKNQQKRLEDQLTIISNEVASGTNLEYEKVAQEVRVHNHAAKIVEVENQLRDIEDYLSTLLGADAKAFLSPAEIMVDNKFLAEQTLQNNLDLNDINLQKQLAEQETALAKSGNLPSIAGVASIGVRNGFVPRINGETPPFSQDFKLNTLLGVKLTIPIYSANRTNMQFHIAKLNEERLEFQRRDIEKRMNYQERSARKNLQNALTLLESQKKAIEQAQYALKLANDRYAQGFIKKLEVDQAENLLEESQLLLVQYMFQAKKQEIELRKIIGETFWK